MMTIKNNKTVNISFDELVLQPGLNFIEKARYDYLITKNEVNNRTFKNLVKKGDLEIVQSAS